MTNSDSARDLRGSGDAGFTKGRRQRGTSLVEILVVIVIFLIGILAVVQIFPRGFQLLLTTRNNSVATALGREAIERLKGSPELIPDEIVPVSYVAGVPVVDPTASPLELTPRGDALSAGGVLTRGGYVVANDWKLASGPNVARRILGEGHRVPAVRVVSSPAATPTTPYENTGGLLVLDHNPIDPGPDRANPRIVAYANEMSRTEGAPNSTMPHDTVPVDANGVSVQVIRSDNTMMAITGAATYTTKAQVAPYEFFTVLSDSEAASVLLPALTTADRTYRLRVSAYVGSTANVHRVDYTALSIVVPRMVASATAPQLVRIPIEEVLQKSGVFANGEILFSVEAESERVAPQYRRVTSWSTPASQGLTGYADVNVPVDPFEMKIQDANLGTLLFSPATRNGTVSRPGGVSEPLVARVDYDVLDWRVIGEDFRLVKNDATVLLSLQSLKVGGDLGSDGLANGGIFNGAFYDASIKGNQLAFDPSPTPRDNVIVVDLTTGYEVQKYRNSGTDTFGRTMSDTMGTDVGSILVSVDKSRGSLTFRDADGDKKNGLQVVLVPPAGDPITVNAAERTFRVLYRGRQEWAVQPLKGASQYSLVNVLPVGPDFSPDEAFVGNGDGGTLPTRIYFASSQAGSKVTIDRIAYLDAANTPQLLEGQDFVLRTGKDNTSLAYADLKDAVGASGFAFQFQYGSSPTHYNAAPVQGIKGASVSVRVLWNPESFTLTPTSTTNLARVEQYNRGWRKSTTQTYLRAEETR